MRHLLPILAAAVGLWLGEHRSAPLSLRDCLIPMLVVLAVLLHCRHARAVSVAAAIGVAAIYGVAWLAGSQEAMRAFNECVQDGDQVREALADYRRMHGRFPDSLSFLDRPVPGRMLLPPHAMHYETDGTHYRLWFADWLTEHAASERQAFSAQK